MKIIILSLLLSRVCAEMQSVQHSMYVSRKSRSNSQPIETSYMYSQYNNDPGFTYSSRNHYKSHSSSADMMDKHRNPSNQYSNYYHSSPSKYSEYSVPISVSNHVISAPPVTEHYSEPITKLDIDYERSKSEAEYNSKIIPAKLKSMTSDYNVPDHIASAPPVTERYIKPVTKLDIDFERSKSEAEFTSEFIPAKLKSMTLDYSVSDHIASAPPVTERYIKPVTKLDIDFERSKSDAEFNNEFIPAKLKSMTSDYSVSDHIASAPPVTERYIEPATKLDIDYERSKSEAKFNSQFIPAKLKSIPSDYTPSNHIASAPPVTESYNKPVTKFDIDYEISKSNAEFNSNFFPAKLKSLPSVYSDSNHIISIPPVTEPYNKPVTKRDIDYERSKSEAEFNSKFIPAKVKSIPLDNSASNHIINAAPVTEPYIESVTKLDIDYEKSKSEAEFNSKYIPAKLKSDVMYEKLKSYMYYNPPDDYKFNEIGYDTASDYHIDDDDVRTSSRTNYDGWPYFYHSPYEYEIHNTDSDIEKAKDKRYANDISRHVIPVHETIENDIPNYNKPQFSPSTYYDHEAPTGNPVHEDKPFISYDLNDFSDKNYDEDPIVFKGFGYDKNFVFDGVRGSEIDDYNKRKRRVEYGDSPKHHVNENKSNHVMVDTKKFEGDSVTEKGYGKKHDFDKKEKKKDEKETYKKGFEKTNNGYTGFKNFADAFANKFGAEGHKKDSKYEFKNNADNGESRRGFRRVYHKDEYQEDNEFYANKNNSARGVEKGTAFSHGNGSEGLIKSHSTANIGDESNALSEAGGSEGNKFENSHHGHDYSHGYDNDFNRYTDVAKKAAQSNSADYGDHYVA